MAITKTNLAGLWLRRDGSIASLSVRYGCTAQYVEEAIRECASKQRLLEMDLNHAIPQNVVAPKDAIV